MIIKRYYLRIKVLSFTFDESFNDITHSLTNLSDTEALLPCVQPSKNQLLELRLPMTHNLSRFTR